MTELDKQIGYLTKLITDLPKADCENCDMSEDYCLTCCYERRLAEHLIDHGVIVPPVKVGDTVYAYDFCQTDDTEGFYEAVPVIVEQISISNKGVWVDCSYPANRTAHLLSAFGKTLFLTKEEAEAALKEREQK